MAKKKSNDNKGIWHRIPCTLVDYKLKQTTNEMILSFAVDESNIDFAKPLMKHTQEAFDLMVLLKEPEDGNQFGNAEDFGELEPK